MKNTQQQLDGRNTYTPLDASQVQSPVTVSLNREETLSEHSLKTPSNNPDVKQLQHTGGLKDNIVYVINKNGKPLMPCRPAKARHLLKTSKAIVVKRTPFTIQLLWNCEERLQPITLGVDAGYSTIGFSAVTEKKEIISGKVELRKDIAKKLTERRMYRRNRRNRLWHRKPRFNNRKKQEEWFAPSIQHKLDSHAHLVERIKRILPITKTIVEVASFDQQKMMNPEITGVEYQQGELQGYEIREYLLEKWGRKCAYCDETNTPLEVEHIIPKSRGGSDRVSNLTISCHKCNRGKGNQTAEEFGYPEIQKQAKETLKATAFMNMVRWKLINILKCGHTYGYITKHNRIKSGLEKSHINDAFVIAGGTTQKRIGHIYVNKQVRRQNRSLFKANILKGGKLKRNTVKEVKGFRRFDKVMYGKTTGFIHALRTSGYFDLRKIDGGKIGASINCKKLKLLERAKGIIQEEVKVLNIPPTTEAVGILSTR